MSREALRIRPVNAGFRSRELEWRIAHPETLAAVANEWVALEGEEIIAHGRDPLQVVKEATEKGIRTPYVFFVEHPEDKIVKMGL